MHQIRSVRYKRVVLEFAAGIGNDAKACREFGEQDFVFESEIEFSKLDFPSSQTALGIPLIQRDLSPHFCSS